MSKIKLLNPETDYGVFLCTVTPDEIPAIKTAANKLTIRIHIIPKNNYIDVYIVNTIPNIKFDAIALASALEVLNIPIIRAFKAD